MAPLRVLLVTREGGGEGPMVEALSRAGLAPAPVAAFTTEGFVALLNADLDVIIADLDAPAFDALTALAARETRAPEVPFIAVTAAADERLARCLRAGATDYVLSDDDVAPAVHRARARRRAEDARRRSETRAATAALLGNVAHELNNPLGILLGQADLLAELAQDGPLKERAHKVVDTTLRCARIIKDFLLVAGRQPLDRRPLDLAGLLREAVLGQAGGLRADGIEIDVSVPGEIPRIHADSEQLHHVLQHLVSNAHHAMLDTPPPRTLRCRASLDREAGVVRIDVADTGSGVLEGLRSRIFEPFFTATRRGRGPGLGLTIAQSIVEAHGGSLRVTSPPGSGATFTIELPLAPAEEERAPTPAVGEGAGARAPLTILIVEDTAEVAGMLVDMLAIDGHHVETAVDGERALDKLRDTAYDLVVTDLRMPALDGPEFYRELARRHPALHGRVIFCSGEAPSLETRAFLARIQAPLVAKPFAAEELRAAIERIRPTRPGREVRPSSGRTL